WLVSFGQIMVMPDPIAYLLVALAGIAYFVAIYRTSARRRAAGLSAKSARGLLLRAFIITLSLEAVALYLNQSRGIPWMFGLFGM
ncbi:sugar ABC transporter permease, partial [Rhizobium ruizarguesonis]